MFSPLWTDIHKYFFIKILPAVYYIQDIHKYFSMKYYPQYVPICSVPLDINIFGIYRYVHT